MMMRLLILLAAMDLVATPLFADPWPDEVVSVTFGPGAGYGQGEHYPLNILGPPDPSATPSAPASGEEELLTLGTGGEIILTFHDGGIEDGEGPDFTIFENAFLVGGGPAIFREVAFVAVSIDGEEWFEFPWDTETWAGFAGATPTDGSADPLDPSVSGGDSFDLADVGLEYALYLRITDAGESITDNGPSFDLDAVAVIHGENQSSTTEENRESTLPQQITLHSWPNPFNARVTIQLAQHVGTVRLTLLDLLGRTVTHAEISGDRWSWAPQGQASGTYLVRVEDEKGQVASQRLVLIR